MAINRYRFYLGPLGLMQALPRLPSGNSPEFSIAAPGAVHTSLSGAMTVDRTGRFRRGWSFSFDNLKEDEELLLQAAMRRSANAPLRLYDPRKRNSLPEDVSTGGSSTLSTVAFTDVGAATPAFLAGDVPALFSGVLSGGINWPTVTNAQQLWGTFEKHPILTGSTYRFSAYLKGSTTFKFGARPFNLAGVEQATVLDGTNTGTATGSWQRFSWAYTPAAGIASAYFGIQATGSGNLQTTGWMVQTDETSLLAWAFGYGCPEVAAQLSATGGYWRTKYHRLPLVLQEL
jgi:hypothetical protein